MNELKLPPYSIHTPTPFASLPLSEQLELACLRVEALNQYRIERALSANNAQFSHVFWLLPLLIHHNIPELPAYVENAPSGIAQFELQKYPQRYFATLTSGENLAKSCQHLTACTPKFEALYSMGSTASIVQTSRSDLDLWLCHSVDLSTTEYQLMEQKFAKLSEWAASFGVEVNFYLMNPQRFKANLHDSGVTDEHSGSAQHFFLLDEFYRSAIRMAGKRLLWLHVSDEQYQKGVAEGDIDLNDWVDFGDFSSLSTAEFFGASLWQLYKGIKSPYKSAIKILLLESYAQTYPETALISKQFKQKLLSDEAVCYHFDPYLAMLEQVTAYLSNRKEFARLDRLRQCFYLKASEGEQLETWRQKDLQQLVAQWHWQPKDVAVLNHRPNWKIKQAMKQHKMLVEHLLQTYRNLIHFARKFHIDPSIMTHDIDTLMRKLYSVFEVLPGKVTLLNPKISQNLAEPEITFIEAKAGSAMKAGWYLVNHSPKQPYTPELRFVEYNKNLHKLVAWGYFNGVITAETKLHLVSSSVDLPKLRQFITDLRLSFPIKAPKMTNDDLLHPNEIRTLTIAINLVRDPTQQLSKRPRSLNASDLFNFGSQQQNLVGSVSVIYRNRWNEIRTQHFEGDDAILNSLKVLSNKVYLGSTPPQSINIFCYSKHLRSELRDSIAELVHRCITLQTGTPRSKLSIDTLKIAGKTWQFVFGKQQIVIQPVPETTVQQQAVENVSFFTNDEKVNVKSSGKPTREPLCYPKEIGQFASEGFLQFFFEDQPNGNFSVYILDEKNHLEIYSGCEGKKEDKVREINRLYSEKSMQDMVEESFNFPQFYQLIQENGELKIVPFLSKQHQAFIASQR